MARYKLILAYDGTQFAGFQRQGQLCEETARFKENLNLLYESSVGRVVRSWQRVEQMRGACQWSQVIAFDLDWRHPMDELQAALNAYLPADMAVERSRDCQG